MFPSINCIFGLELSLQGSESRRFIVSIKASSVFWNVLSIRLSLVCPTVDGPDYLPFSYTEDVSETLSTDSFCYMRADFGYCLLHVFCIQVSSEEYRRILSSVKHEKTAIVHVVDVTDYQNSFIADLLDVMGRFHPVYVVANKIDLIPKDSRGYLQHIEKVIEQFAYKVLHNIYVGYVDIDLKVAR